MEAGEEGLVDASLEEGDVEEVIVTAFNRSISSKVFMSPVSKSFRLCIILADLTANEEISIPDLPPELPAVLAPSSVLVDAPSVDKLVAAGVTAVNCDLRGGLSSWIYARMWATSVFGRAWDLSVGPLLKVIAHPWAFLGAVLQGKAWSYLFRVRPLFKPGW